MSPKRRFQLAISAVLGLTAFGSAGLKLILGLSWFDSFYYTLITITTIGFSEPPGVTQEARYFMAVLIITGVSTRLPRRPWYSSSWFRPLESGRCSRTSTSLAAIS
jgi:hypothetical protein